MDPNPDALAWDIARSIVGNDAALREHADVSVLSELLRRERETQQQRNNGNNTALVQTGIPVATRHLLCRLLHVVHTLGLGPTRSTVVVGNRIVRTEWHAELRKLQRWYAGMGEYSVVTHTRGTHTTMAPRNCIRLVTWRQCRMGASSSSADLDDDPLYHHDGGGTTTTRVLLDLSVGGCDRREQAVLRHLQQQQRHRGGGIRLYVLTPFLCLTTRKRLQTLLQAVVALDDHDDPNGTDAAAGGVGGGDLLQFYYYYCSVRSNPRQFPAIPPLREWFADGATHRRATEDWKVAQRCYDAHDARTRRLLRTPAVLLHRSSTGPGGSIDATADRVVALPPDNTAGLQWVYARMVRATLRCILNWPTEATTYVLQLLQWCAGDRVLSAGCLGNMHAYHHHHTDDDDHTGLRDFRTDLDQSHWRDTVTQLQHWWCDGGTTGTTHHHHHHCIICYEPYGEFAIVVLRCGHCVCLPCFEEHLFDAARCMTCRAPFRTRPPSLSSLLTSRTVDATAGPPGYLVLLRGDAARVLTQPVLTQPRFEALWDRLIRPDAAGEGQQSAAGSAEGAGGATLVLVNTETLARAYRRALRCRQGRRGSNNRSSSSTDSSVVVVVVRTASTTTAGIHRGDAGVVVVRVLVECWQNLFGRDLYGVHRAYAVGPLMTDTGVFRRMLTDQGLQCGITYLCHERSMELHAQAPTELLPFLTCMHNRPSI